MTVESKLYKKLPNGHTLNNPNTDKEWESWKDSFGNEIQMDKKVYITPYIIPLHKNIYIPHVWLRCNCPYCNEEIEVEIGGNEVSDVECPECDREFRVDMEN